MAATTPSVTFGGWLRQRRRALELTQAQLARRVPCAEVTIRKLESGAMRPGKELVERVAECLDLSTAEREQFVLVGRGLATPAALAGAPAAPRHNLLEPPTPIVGREREVAALRDRLLRQSARLLTITGPGGVGKTRLLREVALRIRDDFQDGVFLVELAPVAAATLVLPTIAGALGLREERGTPVLDMLKAFLAPRHLLLLLDNFEHLLDAAGDIGALVEALPRAKVVVTSRERLNLTSEQEFPLSPLEVPPGFEGDPVPYAAVRLFVQRAASANPDFTLNNANRAAVAELCARLDGLPLAIELAAARSKLLGPRALLARLDDRFALLRGGRRDLPARQQSLRATLDWSYELLSAPDQRALARLGIFAGGATLEAAEAVCRGRRNSDLLDIFASLVDKSLVRQVETEEGEPRLLLLETVRVYALEKLEEMGLLDETRQRHTEYFLALAEQGEEGLRRAAQVQWLALLKAETDNFRAVLAWTLEQPSRAATGLRMAGTLVWFWEYGGLHREGYRWIERLLAAGEDAGPALRIKAANAAAFLTALHWDIDESRRMLEISRTLHEETRLPWGRGEVIWFLAASTVMGNKEEHIENAEWALRLFSALDDPWGLAMAKWGVAFLRAYNDVAQASDVERNLRLLHESEALLRTQGDRWSLAFVELGFGAVMAGQQQYARAVLHFEKALQHALEGGSPGLIDVSLTNLAHSAHSMGDLQRRRDVFRERYERTRHHIAGRSALACLSLATAERDLFDYPRAVALLRETVTFAARHGMWHPLIHAFYELVETVAAAAEFPEQVPPDSAANLARALFRTVRLSPSYERELWIFAATLLGAIAPMLDPGLIGDTWPRDEWFSVPLRIEPHLDYSTMRASLHGGYAMTTEQAVAYALNERPGA